MANATSQITSLPFQRQQMETRFVALMTELFHLDEAEALDFGLYRVIRRHNREVHAFLGESVAVFFRDCAAKDSSQWVAGKLAQHPADRVCTNKPASLSFEGCDCFEAIETVFALQFGRQ